MDAVNDLSEDRYGRPQRVDPIEAHHRATETIGGPANYAHIQLPGGANYREMLLNLPYQKGPEYFGPHWDEPNVLAHMRLSDRTGPNGEKVLHLEELQSDWHQQGREKGYKQNGQKQYENEISQLAKKYGIDTTNKSIAIIESKLNPHLTNEENNKLDAIEKIKLNDMTAMPDAPFKKNWRLNSSAKLSMSIHSAID